MTDLARAVELLHQGRLVAFPTETVYGLGADAANPAAIDRIYQTKGRPSTNPLIIHVASADVARRYVTHWPTAAAQLARTFWPGPLTLILPKRAPAQNPGAPSAISTQHSALSSIPDNATASLQTVALRVPDHPLAMALLRAFDGPLAAPSANRSTRVSPTTAQHVRDEFPQSAAVTGQGGLDPAMILDGGPCAIGIESTVLDLTVDPPAILRPGRLGSADLQPVIGPVRLAHGTLAPGVAAASPGQQDVHYAPRARTCYFDARDATAVFRLIATSPPLDGLLVLDTDELRGRFSPDHPLIRGRRIIAMPAEPAAYARRFYATLRELDDRGAAAIWIESPPVTDQWAAIHDRLRRAGQPARVM